MYSSFAASHAATRPFSVMPIDAGLMPPLQLVKELKAELVVDLQPLKLEDRTYGWAVQDIPELLRR